MDELRELQRHTELLEELIEEIQGLRADMNNARKEAMEGGMKKAMEQMTSAFRGSPIEGIVRNMMSKTGGGHGQ